MSSKKRGLGRSFSSLIPDELFDESFDPTLEQDEKVSDLRQIRVEDISSDPGQPRKNFDQDALEQLSSSIVEHGILQPIVLVPSKDSGYIIVAGERRWRAAKMAGLDKVPAIIRTLSSQHKLELSLIENLQRRDLNPIETATAYLKLRDQFNMSLDMIAQRMGVGAVSTISNKLRLLKLPKSVLDLVAKGDIREGQVRPLIGLDPEVVEDTVRRIISEGWSARKVEQFVVNLKTAASDREEPKPRELAEVVYADRIKLISDRLNTKVKISTNSKGAGRITINFKNEEDLERINQLLTEG